MNITENDYPDFSIFSMRWAISVLFMFSWTSTNPVSLWVWTIASEIAEMMKPKRRRPKHGNKLHTERASTKLFCQKYNKNE